MRVRKSDMKKAKDSELILDFASTYNTWEVNMYTGLATKQAEQHFHDLGAELVRRGILTEEEVDSLVH